jgi:hypothetical protein
MQLLRRLRYLIHQRQLDADLAEEMEFQRAMSGGRDFGNATLVGRPTTYFPFIGIYGPP